jgi:hypothetical protein
LWAEMYEVQKIAQDYRQNSVLLQQSIHEWLTCSKMAEEVSLMNYQGAHSHQLRKETLNKSEHQFSTTGET